MKFSIFAAIILFLGAVFFFGCETCWWCRRPLENNNSNNDKELKEIQEQVKVLARKAGLPSGTVAKSSASQLLVDIEIMLDNGDDYYGKVLTDEEMKLLNDLLGAIPQTQKTIKEYHEYISGVKGKKVVIIPDGK